jgi:hypothetical protein
MPADLFTDVALHGHLGGQGCQVGGPYVTWRIGLGESAPRQPEPRGSWEFSSMRRREPCRVVRREIEVSRRGKTVLLTHSVLCMRC